MTALYFVNYLQEEHSIHVKTVASFWFKSLVFKDIRMNDVPGFFIISIEWI